MTIDIWSSCAKPFMVWEQKTEITGMELLEPVTCPYCSHSVQKVSTSWWNTAALSAEEQQEYLSERGA